MAKDVRLVYNLGIVDRILNNLFPDGFAREKGEQDFCGFFGKIAVRVSYYHSVMSIDKFGKDKFKGWMEECLSDIFEREIAEKPEQIDYDENIIVYVTYRSMGFDLFFKYKQ